MKQRLLTMALPATVNGAGEGQSFSWRRFQAYLRVYMATRGKSMLMVLGVILGVLTTFMLINVSDGTYQELHRELPGDIAWKGECFIMDFVGMMTVIVVGSMMYSGLGSKEERLSSLVLPASRLEQFAVRFLLYVPVFLVAFFGCCWLADMIRVVVVKLFMHPMGEVAPIPLKMMLTFGEYTPWMSQDSVAQAEAARHTVSTFGFLLLAEAVAALGSSFFPKLALVKTMVAVFLLSSVSGLLFVFSRRIFFSDSQDFVDVILPVWSVAAVFGVMAIVCYWLSYARFKESEVIDRW